jgi:hypothetical protein
MEEKVIQPDDTLKSSCHQEVPALYSSASKGPSCSKVAHTTSPDLHVRAHAPSRAPRGGTPPPFPRYSIPQTAWPKPTCEARSPS